MAQYKTSPQQSSYDQLLTISSRLKTLTESLLQRRAEFEREIQKIDSELREITAQLVNAQMVAERDGLSRPLSNESLTNVQKTALALRPREAAKALGISVRTLYDWTKNGDIPHIRQGKAVLYPINAVTKWLEVQVQKTAK